MTDREYIYFTGIEKKFVERMVGKECFRFVPLVPTPVRKKIADFFVKNYRFERVNGDPVEFARKKDVWKKSRVVVVTNTSIGDTILALPATREFAKSQPWHRITLCSHPRNAGLIRGLDFIDDFLSIYEFRPFYARYPHARQIVFQDYAEVHADRAKVHRSQIYASKLGFNLNGHYAPRLRPDPKLAEGWGIPFREGRKFAIVQLRSVSPLRSWDWRWPSSRRFPKAEFLVKKMANEGINVIVLDAEHFKEFTGKRIYNLTGKTKTSEELVALTERCDVAICCGDSGLAHIAGSVGVPFLGIYGPINPDLRLKYYGVRHFGFYKKLPCANCQENTGGCQRPCMNFSVEEVYNKAVELGGLKK